MECIVLDTDIIVGHLRGMDKAVRFIEILEDEYTKLYTTVINLFELYYGAYCIGSRKKIASIRKIEDRLEILNLNERIAKKAGEELARLSKEGLVVDNRDLLIGIIARENGCKVVAGNEKYFRRIHDLEIVNWKKQ